MRKNRIITIMNWLLLYSIPIILLTVQIKIDKIDSKILTKKLSTSIFINYKEEEKKQKKEYEQEKQEIEEENKSNQEQEKITISPKDKEEKKELLSTSVVEEIKNDVIASYSGSISFYNANCVGCSGITSTGIDVSDGRLYYQDKTYGNVRIIAAGNEIKKWSIVRIKNSSLGKDSLAIVLDRGGDIGQGKKFIIDVLTNSNENKGGVEKNITVEVIREGK